MTTLDRISIEIVNKLLKCNELKVNRISQNYVNLRLADDLVFKCKYRKYTRKDRTVMLNKAINLLSTVNI